MIFTSGQAVTIIHAGHLRELELARVARVTHGGKRVFLEGTTTVFDERGQRKEGLLVRGTFIRPTTDEDRGTVERVALWKRLDRVLSPWWARPDEREKARASITTEVLRQVVALLETGRAP